MHLASRWRDVVCSPWFLLGEWQMSKWASHNLAVNFCLARMYAVEVIQTGGYGTAFVVRLVMDVHIGRPVEVVMC